MIPTRTKWAFVPSPKVVKQPKLAQLEIGATTVPENVEPLIPLALAVLFIGFYSHRKVRKSTSQSYHTPNDKVTLPFSELSELCDCINK